MKPLLTEQQKRKKGLIKTPAKKLHNHFNYYYLFSDPKTDQTKSPKNITSKKEKKK